MPTSHEIDLGADAPASAPTGFAVLVGGTAHGSIGVAGDADYIAVDLIAGRSYSFAMTGLGAANLTDAVLRLFAPDGTTQIAQNDNDLGGGNALIRHTAAVSGRYFLQASGAAGLTGDYAVAASPGPRAGLDGEMLAGLLDSHASWASARGAAVTLSFGFAATNTQGQTGFSQFTQGQMEAARAVLAQFAEVAGLSFSEVNAGGYTDDAALLYGNYSAADGLDGWGGAPADPAFASGSGDVWMNTAAPPVDAPLPGSFDYGVLLREIGRSLGLNTPGLYAGGLGGALSYGLDADIVQDSAQFTVMSPFGAGDTGGSPHQPDTLGIADILALQLIYGANSATRAGDTSYGFGSNAGQVYDFDWNLDPRVTIWDGGGIDRLDLSRYSAAQTISLLEGTQSSVGGHAGNLGIAFGTVIEEVIGGRGADVITGNAAANLICGGGRNDVLMGGAGDDTLEGGSGGDTLRGEAGNDVLRGDSSPNGGIPPQSFGLVSTNGAAGARLEGSGIDLFPTQSFTVELLWQQLSLADEGYVMEFGNLAVYRHADGSASIRFNGAEIDDWLPGILPAALTDGSPHRLSMSYDDIEGRLRIYLDGVQTAERLFPTTTRGLSGNGSIVLGDHAAVGDLRIFDFARSAQDIWDNAWTSLADPLSLGGLLHSWQGDGSGGLVNLFESQPDLAGVGPVASQTVELQDLNTGNRMEGGAGDDTYHVLSSLDRVIEAVGGGMDTVFAHVDFALGAGQSVDRLIAADDSGGITLSGNGGANHLTSSALEADTLIGGLGNDTYQLYHSGDQVVETAGGGNDVILAFVDYALAAGCEVEEIRAMGPQGLSLTGNERNNRLVSAVAFADTLSGGGGDDRYSVYNARTRVIEQAGGGMDHLYAYANHVLAAGSQVEDLYAMGDAGRVLTGNELNNRFTSNPLWADTLFGGAGNDVFYLYNADDRAFEAAGGGTDIIYAHADHTLAGGSEIETLQAAGATGLALTGNSLGNILSGNTAFADTLRGGAGDDVYFVRNSLAQVIEGSATGGYDVVNALVNHALVAGSFVEVLRSQGSRGLVLTGNERANEMISNAAFADTLVGGAGNDSYTVLNAGTRVIEAATGGFDVLYAHVSHGLAAGSAVEEMRAAVATGLRLTGNELDNAIFGGLGADTLVGGGGRDLLYGGVDGLADVFLFRSLEETAVGPTRDVVHDFVSGLDQINLRGVDANTGLTGNQAFVFSSTGPLAFGLWLISGPGGLVLQADATGDAVADLEIALQGVAVAQGSDFLL